MTTFNLAAILPPKEAIDAMGRRRYQHPRVQQTATKDRGTRRWYFRYRIDALIGAGETGRTEERCYLGNVTEMTKRDAEKRRDEILAEIVNKPELVITSQVRFGVVLDRFLAVSNVRDSSQAAYKSMVKVHFRPKWGNARMCDITPLAVEEWLVALSRNLSRATLATARQRFNQVWNCAVRWRFTREITPAFGIPPMRASRPERSKKLPSAEQFHRLIYQLEEPYRSIVITCAFTGLRIGEVMALKWSQINSEYAEITEAATQHRKICPLKTEKSARIVAMSHFRADLMPMRDALPDDRPFLVTYATFRQIFKEAAQEAEFDYPGFGAHTFRRMHNTLFRREAGSDTAMLQLAREQLGHSNQKTNDLYYVQDEVDVRKRGEVSGEVYRRVMEAAPRLLRETRRNGVRNETQLILAPEERPQSPLIQLQCRVWPVLPPP